MQATLENTTGEANVVRRLCRTVVKGRDPSESFAREGEPARTVVCGGFLDLVMTNKGPTWVCSSCGQTDTEQSAQAQREHQAALAEREKESKSAAKRKLESDVAELRRQAAAQQMEADRLKEQAKAHEKNADRLAANALALEQGKPLPTPPAPANAPPWARPPRN